MSTPINYQALTSEKLRAASEYIGENWLPLNRYLVDEIYQKLEANFYKNCPDQLIEDLKCDIGLLTLSMKELAEVSDGKVKSIYERLKSCDAETMRSILAKGKRLVEDHALEHSDAAQINQLHATLTSTAITETLAGAHNIDPEMAYLSALFRQIGLTFIAWNYPSIFKNCLHSATSEEEFLESMNRALGFSPAMLGVRLAKEWQMPSYILRVLDTQKPQAETPPEEDASEMENRATPETLIVKLCKIGELFASLNNENYPAQEEVAWNRARNEILRNLGSRGFRLIEENLNKLCRHYIKAIPRLSENPVTQKLDALSKPDSRSSLFHSNAYIKFLSLEAQAEMHDFYMLITPEGLSKESVSFLRGRLISSLGFARGCLYLIDPDSQTLYPRLAFGDSNLKDFPSIILTGRVDASDPIIKGFHSSNPVTRREMAEYQDEIIHICGPLGSLQRAGVLYLEPSPDLRTNNKANPMLYFRAVLRGIEDCLALR